ncbi:flavodoxin family protein [Thalassotalea fusca]
MIRVVVVFHSVTGTTKQLAQAVTDGAVAQNGVDAQLIEIKGKDIVDGRYINVEVLAELGRADALIFGSPTFMGSVSAQFKALADATGDLWADRAWADKLAAGFTIGSNLSGDQLNTIQYMQVFASQHGMLWISLDIPGNCDPDNLNRLGAQSGLIAHSIDGQLDELDLKTAQYLGLRVAQMAVKFNA